MNYALEDDFELTVNIQLDVCQQPPRTHNSITNDVQVFIYRDIFQRITVSSSGGTC
jgi:hypothetical protein